MTKHGTLLSFVVRHRSAGLEDMATAGLHFILSRSKSARRALSELLGDDGAPLPVAKAEPWSTGQHGAVPDLSCRDMDGNLVAFIEAKFWASLTHHQPVTYWEELPDDRPAVLLFLAPDCRVNGTLWGELVELLRKAGHELGPDDRGASFVTAPAQVGHRRLMLTSWESLLNKLMERAAGEDDAQACFEIAELQGLAASAIASDNPRSDENLKQLIREAVERVERSGWANTAGLREADVAGSYYAKYVRLAGASVGVRVDRRAVKQMRDKPLWLWFYDEPSDSVSVEAVRSRLGSLAESLEWLGGDVCVPILLPTGADTVKAIVSTLERVAKLIDPSGPTYQETVDNRPMTRPEPQYSVGSRGKDHAIKVVCWNIDTMHEPWRELVEMDADVALLQEVGTVPEDVRDRVELSPYAPWLSHDPVTGESSYDRWPMVVRLSDRVEVEWFRQVGPTWVSAERPEDVAVSGIGTVEVARVIPLSGPEPFIAASMYARWFDPHPTADGNWIYPDGSAHRIISDLSAFIGYYESPEKHRILAAGDLNMGFRSTNEFNHRAQTVLDRFQALGFDYMGPQYPAGRRADPIPKHLTEKSLDVPTYYHKPSNTPAGAYAQIDHVFASRGFHEEVRAKALNGVGEWGPSDHCRVRIDVGASRSE